MKPTKAIARIRLAAVGTSQAGGSPQTDGLALFERALTLPAQSSTTNNNHSITTEEREGALSLERSRLLLGPGVVTDRHRCRRGDLEHNHGQTIEIQERQSR